MFRHIRRPSSGSTIASYRRLVYSIEMSGYMLRSHHLCCMAKHIEKLVKFLASEIRESVCRGYNPGTHLHGSPKLHISQVFLCVLPYSTDDEISTSNHSFL